MTNEPIAHAAAAQEAWQLVHENERLRDEIARLRLTDAEREALEWAGGNEWWTDRNTRTGERHAATLRGLLERLGGGE